MFDDTRPIFLQLAERIADDILRGRYAEGEQVPSTNEFSSHLRINPATAGKALGLLVDLGVLVKRRGIGMFVAEGAREGIIAERGQRFVDDYVRPLLIEAEALGLDVEAVTRLIDETRQTMPPQRSAPRNQARSSETQSRETETS